MNVALLGLAAVVVGAAYYVRGSIPGLPEFEPEGGPYYDPNDDDPWVYDFGTSVGEIDFTPASGPEPAPESEASSWWDWPAFDDGPRFTPVPELGTADDVSLAGAEGWGMSEAPQTWPFADIIYAAAAEYGARAELIAAMIRTESSFNPNAQASTSSARGLMQMTRAAAQDVGADYEALYDPETNIFAGTAYLARMLRQFGSDEHAAVRAYYQGAGNERKGAGSPLYAEALKYEDKVFSHA